jgi:hypothetical protein
MVFRDTLVVEDIVLANHIGYVNKMRVITVDGILIEQSGVISGGYYYIHYHIYNYYIYILLYNLNLYLLLLYSINFIFIYLLLLYSLNFIFIYLFLLYSLNFIFIYLFIIIFT